MVRFTVVLVAIGLLPTADADVAGELAHMLARYPEADADRDGILTEAEAGEYILRKFQRKRPNRGPGIGDRSLIKVYEAVAFPSAQSQVAGGGEARMRRTTRALTPECG